MTTVDHTAFSFICCIGIIAGYIGKGCAEVNRTEGRRSVNPAGDIFQLNISDTVFPLIGAV